MPAFPSGRTKAVFDGFSLNTFSKMAVIKLSLCGVKINKLHNNRHSNRARLAFQWGRGRWKQNTRKTNYGLEVKSRLVVESRVSVFLARKCTSVDGNFVESRPPRPPEVITFSTARKQMRKIIRCDFMTKLCRSPPNSISLQSI